MRLYINTGCRLVRTSFLKKSSRGRMPPYAPLLKLFQGLSKNLAQAFSKGLGRVLLSIFAHCVPIIVLIISLAGCGIICNTGIFNTGKTQVGMASWYGDEFHGCATTNGQEYDMNRISAAHRTLPFGTLVRVTNLSNNKSVLVQINDRGPWVPERVIDLSYAAASKIDMVSDGVARVRLDVVEEQVGIAAWYGKEFHGKPTASGEIFDMNELTGAHYILPFGSRVRVTNIGNGKVITVTINDRIAESLERVINFSRKAAEKLGFLKAGTTRVIRDIPGETVLD